MDKLSRAGLERRLRSIDAIDPGEIRSMADWIWKDLLEAKGPGDMTLGASARARLEDALHRLETGEPIQYITGHAYFFGYRFLVDRSTLIPRPETEELVAWALEVHRASGPGPCRILDIGTGSGCIAITLALKLGAQAEVTALDVSGDALAIARENARRLGASVEWVQADFLEASMEDLGGFDLVISNPPYVDPSRVGPDVMEGLRFEPFPALVAPGPDPDIFYRHLARKGKHLLSPGRGRVLAEINEFRADLAREIFVAAGWGAVEVRNDLAGHPRMLLAAGAKDEIPKEG